MPNPDNINVVKPKSKSFKISQGTSYNLETKRVFPVSWKFMGLTLLLILGPTITMMVCLLVQNPYISEWLKITFGSISVVTMGVSLKYLFVCAFSDPGVIPANLGENE
jgi:hypothetical protein